MSPTHRGRSWWPLSVLQFRRLDLHGLFYFWLFLLDDFLGLLLEGDLLFFFLFLVPLIVYLLSWIGWFLSPRGWSRSWSADNGGDFLASIRSFIHYQFEILNFHKDLDSGHNYRSSAWQWLLQIRPTSFYYESPQGCGSNNCAQEVLALGTPVLWWSATIAVVVLIGYWMWQFYQRQVDSKLTFILLGIIAGYLPWFFFQQRTVFSFYAIVFEPFLILAVHRLL